MILDRIDRLARYEELIPGAARIAAAFEAQNPQDAPCEVRQKRYALKEDGARRFEVHGHTIDLMMALEGAEVIHICRQEELVGAEVLPNGGDGRKLDGGPRGSAVLLERGWFCAIFPGEAHMVGGRTDAAAEISKWVVKAPCRANWTVKV